MITDQPAAPRKKRHGCLIGIAGAVALVIVVSVIAAIAGGGGGTSTGGASGSGGSTGSSHAAGIGDPVRDGKFQFVINRVSHRIGVGTLGTGITAQGMFTVLHVLVTNIGTESQTLDDSSQYVFDGSGRKFDASTEADIYANPSGDSMFLQDINPGNSVRGVIYFDLPQGDQAVKAELHDSAFSGGVTVNLGG